MPYRNTNYIDKHMEEVFYFGVLAPRRFHANLSLVSSYNRLIHRFRFLQL